jgi:hypothetical protein
VNAERQPVLVRGRARTLNGVELLNFALAMALFGLAWWATVRVLAWMVARDSRAALCQAALSQAALSQAALCQAALSELARETTPTPAPANRQARPAHFVARARHPGVR